MPVPLSTAQAVESAITNIVPKSVVANSSQANQSFAPPAANQSIAPESSIPGFSGAFQNNAPAVLAPHPASTPSPVPPPASPNRSVTLPNGAIVQIDNLGNIVSGDATNSAAKTYAANQTDTAAAADAAKLAASKGISGAPEVKQAYDTPEGNQLLTAAEAKARGLTPAGSSTNPFIGTSDSVIAQEDQLKASLQDLKANDPATQEAHNNYIQTLADEAAALEARREKEEASINADFNSQKGEEEGKQANETGVLNISLQRSGGFLGMGASQTGALLGLNKSHSLTMQSLEQKRQAALLAAHNAIDDKQFALAEAKAKEAKDYLTEQNNQKQKYLEDLINVNKAQQDNVTYAQDQAQKSLTALSSLTPDDLGKVDPATLKNIDSAYGVPGFAKSYITTTHAINAAKSQNDAIAAQKNMLDLLQAIPNGQKVTFPDPANPSGPGVTYTGIGKTGDISTFMETDNYGNNTLITYDKGSNTITRMAAGSGGKTSASVDAQQASSGRVANIDQFINDPANKVLIAADPTNPNSPKYMTADNYVSMYQKYVKVYPGQGKEFLDAHPLEETVLPSQVKNPTLTQLTKPST